MEPISRIYLQGMGPGHRAELLNKVMLEIKVMVEFRAKTSADKQVTIGLDCFCINNLIKCVEPYLLKGGTKALIFEEIKRVYFDCKVTMEITPHLQGERETYITIDWSA
jgi:hypothetical protein